MVKLVADHRAVPALEQTAVYVQSAKNQVVALAKADGKLLWTYQTGSHFQDHIRANPLLTRDPEFVLILTRRAVHAVHPTDADAGGKGRQLWKFQFSDSKVDQDPQPHLSEEQDLAVYFRLAEEQRDVFVFRADYAFAANTAQNSLDMAGSPAKKGAGAGAYEHYHLGSHRSTYGYQVNDAYAVHDQMLWLPLGLAYAK